MDIKVTEIDTQLSSKTNLIIENNFKIISSSIITLSYITLSDD